ncbi:serine hydrolase domain-containing protein [Erythrobacter sp. HA6-11]
MKSIVFAVLAGLFLLTGQAHARPSQAQLDELTTEVDKALEESGIVGFSAVLTDGEQIIWSTEHGHLDKAREHPVTLDAPFRIGSVTKTITAIAILQLAEQGLITLEDPISNYIDTELYENEWSNDRPITIAHLLEHTSGWDDLHFEEYGDYPADITLEEGLGINPGSRVSRWPAGTVSSYSNSGPAVAGRIIEIVTGLEYTDYVEKSILLPLNLQYSGFDMPIEERLQSFQDEETTFSFTNIWAEPSGGLAMSAHDLATIVNLLMADGGDLLSRESIERMETPTTSLLAKLGVADGDGAGLETRNRKGHFYHLHSGAIDGFNSEFGYLPSAGLGYVILTNSQATSAYLDVLRAMRGVIETDVDRGPSRAIVASMPFEGLEGAYRSAATRNGTFYMLDLLLGAQRIEVNDNALTLSSYVFGEAETLHHLGDGLLSDDEGVSVSHMIAYMDGRYVLISPDGDVLEQTSAFSALAPIVLLGLTVLAALIGLLAIIGASIFRVFKTFELRRFVAIWLGPVLAGASLILFAGVLITHLNTPLILIENFSKLTLASGTLWVSSLGLPLFAALGLFLLVKASDRPVWLRAVVGLFCAAQLCFAAVLFSNNWVGFTAWAIDVEPYSIGHVIADYLGLSGSS